MLWFLFFSKLQLNSTAELNLDILEEVYMFVFHRCVYNSTGSEINTLGSFFSKLHQVSIVRGFI